MYKKMLIVFSAATILSACGNSADAEKEVIEAQFELHGDYANLPEYLYILEEIEADQYNFNTVSDNEDKRVISIQADRENYRSIYIHNTSRLIIQHEGDQGEIFNEEID